MGKHYGQTIICDVLKMRNEGRTNREIGEQLGLSKVQIKKLLERYRKKREKARVRHPNSFHRST